MFDKYDLLNLPFMLYSKGVGSIARAPLPEPLNEIILGAYARKFGVNLDEAEKPLSEYHSLYQFFTRRLKAGSRSFSPNPAVVIAPSDGVIRDFGNLSGGRLLQAKRYQYSLSSLIGEDDSPIFHEGIFVTHYLRPGDYHRFHYPIGGVVKKIIYFPGKIFPVNPTAERKIPALYAINERVFLLIERERGHVGVVMIGASAVGEIHINLWNELKTNSPFKVSMVQVSPMVKVSKGDEMGYFGMGSSIITLIERGKLSERLHEHTFLKMGSSIATLG